MGLAQISPIKIKLKEVKSNKINNPQLHPIKIKICDRDKNMFNAYETKKVKVIQKDGKILVKNKKEILETDRILEFLSNDYIKPIRIKISTLDMVYNWLYDLLFKFNFLSVIAAGCAIVISYIKFTFKLFHKTSISYAFSKMFGRFNQNLKSKHLIEVALDIFKVEGLFNSIKIKYKLGAFLSYRVEFSPIKLQFSLPEIKDVMVVKKVPKTIEELTTGTIEDQFLGNKTILDVLYKVEELNPDGTPIDK